MIDAPFFPKPVLVVLDGSRPSQVALRLAAEIAKATGSPLHTIWVAIISRYNLPMIMSEAQVERVREDAKERLAAEVAEAGDLGIEVTAQEVRLGRMDSEVLRLGETLRVGLIVIGNRSVEAIDRILLGDDMESIVRHAHCPVLVAREDDWAPPND